MTDDPISAPAASLDTSVFRLLVHAGIDDPDYRPFTRNVAFQLTYFVDAELRAGRWATGVEDAVRDLRKRCTTTGPPDERTKDAFVRAKRVFDLLGFSQAQRNHTDLWILAQTVQNDLPLLTHDKQMVRIADALGAETITLLRGIDQQLAADRRRLANLLRDS